VRRPSRTSGPECAVGRGLAAEASRIAGPSSTAELSRLAGLGWAVGPGWAVEASRIAEPG
jgi:hypothetical protein